MATLDNFTRADSATLGPNWTVDPYGFGGAWLTSLEIVSNTAKAVGAARGSYWNPSTFPANCYSQAQIGVAGKLTEPGLFTANVGLATCQAYVLDCNDATTAWEIYRIDGNAVQPLIASTTFNAALGDYIRIALEGTSVKTFHSTDGITWNPILSVVDNTYRSATTTASLVCDPNGQADSFGAGSFPETLPSDTPFVPLGRGASW